MADRYVRAAGGNYNAAGTWELTPGGGESVAVPTASDAVKTTASSGNLTITAAAAALSADFTSYVGTLVINASQTWTVSGSVTLGSGMTWTANTGTIATGTSGTWTFNGKMIPCAFSITAAVTITLGDSGEVDGAFSCTNTGTTTINGSSFTLRCDGNVTLSGTTAGTATLRFGGTGTWVGSSTTTRRLQMATVIDTAGTLTLGANPRIGNGTTLTYVAGTVTPTNAIQVNGNCTLAMAGVSGISYSVDGVSTITLSQDLDCNDFGVGSNTTVSGAFDVDATSVTHFATSTLTRARAWTIGTYIVGSGFTGTIEGAFDQTVSELRVTSSGVFQMRSGQTLTVTSAVASGASNGTTLTSTIKSITASSAFTLDYQGGHAGNRVFRATFTDVNMATGQTLWNYHGQTLTRTNGIVNFTSPPVPRASAAVG